MSWASSESARRTMQANRRRDTQPELAVRRLLHSQGHRYRVDFPPLGGRRRADVVFTRLRIAVFVDGCFWHSCPMHSVPPKRNRDYWEPKLRRNVERDRETDVLLRAAGWQVLRFWEHEPATSVAVAIAAAIAERRDSLGSPRSGATSSLPE
ncbi:very short patch repair endonuclease [Microbacterium sp. NPDC055665]